MNNFLGSNDIIYEEGIQFIFSLFSAHHDEGEYDDNNEAEGKYDAAGEYSGEGEYDDDLVDKDEDDAEAGRREAEPGYGRRSYASARYTGWPICLDS